MKLRIDSAMSSATPTSKQVEYLGCNVFCIYILLYAYCSPKVGLWLAKFWFRIYRAYIYIFVFFLYSIGKILDKVIYIFTIRISQS